MLAAPNNYQDLNAALNQVVDRHLADVVTNSYVFDAEFLPHGYIKPVNDTLVQAAAEGMSGDYATIFTRPGYDDVTGLGSPTASFYGALAAAH